MGVKQSFILALVLLCVVTTRGTTASFDPPVFRSATDQFTLLMPSRFVSKTTVHGLDGTVVDLGHFDGKVLVVNFWATWCRPCAYEMPSLDRLAATADPTQLAVIAVSIDQDGPTAVIPYIAARGLTHLPVYLDPDQRLGSTHLNPASAGAMPLWGLPITYVIDPAGRVIGYLTGAAKWDSPAAHTLLDYFRDQSTR